MAREIQKVVKQTPIEIALQIDPNGMTTAKKLYEFLGMDKSQYSRWTKTNILENPFAEKGIDYEVFDIHVEKPKGGRPSQDFKLSANFAKKLSMQGKTERAEEARDYFIAVEDKLKQIVKSGEISHRINQLYITSRDLCRMVGRKPIPHGIVMQEIRNIIGELEMMGFDRREYFIDSIYKGVGNSNKQTYPQFLCTERGCEAYSGRLGIEERREFLIEVTDRFDRMRDAMAGRPVRKSRAHLEDCDTVIRLYRNNDWYIMTVNEEVYNLTPREMKEIGELIPKLKNHGIQQVQDIIRMHLEESDRSGKLEAMGEYSIYNDKVYDVKEPPREPEIPQIAEKEDHTKTTKQACIEEAYSDMLLSQVQNLNEAQAMARYNIGRHSLRRISDDIGAVVWVGRKRLYCREVMDRHFLSISE